ncbi:uncharacterized protein LOC120650538 isoform X2 [Panicum virgatum]|uniref:Uncharacterized protein n=1 Tax=Panicum virgatum TaxID=38727 RepID=A0A8T0NFX2_PANVG|nr:uncharacterized protein LOC120650538 isoform X2 [Panicum virgatum]KAG2547778.1 hypothetical protein PVAP13_9KG125400 [Panicum virgatum]
MKTGPERPFPSLSGPEQSPVSSHPDSFLETRRVRGAGGGRGDEAAARILDGNPPRHLLTVLGSGSGSAASLLGLRPPCRGGGRRDPAWLLQCCLDSPPAAPAGRKVLRSSCVLDVAGLEGGRGDRVPRCGRCLNPKAARRGMLSNVWSPSFDLDREDWWFDA